MMPPTAMRAHSDDLRWWSMTAVYVIRPAPVSMRRDSAAGYSVLRSMCGWSVWRTFVFLSRAYAANSSDAYGLPSSFGNRSLMDLADLSGETRTMSASGMDATRYWIILFDVAPTAATAAAAASSRGTGSPAAAAAAAPVAAASASAPASPSTRRPLPGASSLRCQGAAAMRSSISPLTASSGNLRARRPVRTASYWSGNPCMSCSHEAT